MKVIFLTSSRAKRGDPERVLIETPESGLPRRQDTLGSSQ